jgi:SAM-dependent methyltransferase
MNNNNSSQQTIGYYNKEATAFITGTLNVEMSSLYKEFVPLVKPNGHILDAGCGTGRDSLYFLQQGFSVTAFDGSAAMVSHAQKLIGQPVLQLKFEELDFTNSFDAVWASASLLHVPHAEIDDVVFRISRALIDEGIFYASFKYGVSEGFRNERLFSDYKEESFAELIARHSYFSILKTWKTVDVRPSRSEEYWLNTLCMKKL